MKLSKKIILIILIIILSSLSFYSIKNNYFSKAIAMEILPWNIKWGMTKDELIQNMGELKDVPDAKPMKYKAYDLVKDFSFLGFNYKVRFFHNRKDDSLEEIAIYSKHPKGFDNIKNCLQTLYGVPQQIDENNYVQGGIRFVKYKGFWEGNGTNMMLNRRVMASNAKSKTNSDLSLLLLTRATPDLESEFPTLTTIRCEAKYKNSHSKKDVVLEAKPWTMYIDPTNKKLMDQFHNEPGRKEIFTDEEIVYFKETKNSVEKLSLNRKSGIVNVEIQLKQGNTKIEEWGFCEKVDIEAAL